MTITYPTGTVRDVVLVSDDDYLLRVALPDGAVRKFTSLQGVWLSDACEPVILTNTYIGV